MYTTEDFSNANKALTALGVHNDMDKKGGEDFLRTNETDHDAHRYTDEEMGNVGKMRISEGQLRKGLAYARHFSRKQEGKVDSVQTSPGTGGPPKDCISEMASHVMDPFARYLTGNKLEKGFKDVASLALFALGVRKDTTPGAVRDLLRCTDIDSLSFEHKERVNGQPTWRCGRP